ncbi:hypothetical protein ACHAXS_007214 [Conticribra weissflogii]
MTKSFTLSRSLIVYHGRLFLTTTLLLLLFIQPSPVKCQSDASPAQADCTVDFCEEALSDTLAWRYRIHVPNRWEEVASTDIDAYNSCPGCKITIALTCDGMAWIGFGVSLKGEMIGSHVVIGQPQSSEPKLYRIFGKNVNLIEPSENQPLVDATIDFISGKTFMEFTVAFEDFGVQSRLGTEPSGLSLTGISNFIWAHGNDGQPNLAYHGSNRHAFDKFNLSGQAIKNSAEMDGVMGSSAIKQDEEEHDSSHKSAWAAHGVMAFLAWGICAPIAIASAILRDIDGKTIWRGLQDLVGRGLRLLGKKETATPAEGSGSTFYMEMLSYWWLYIHMGCNTINYLFTFIVFIVAVSTTSKESIGENESHFNHAHSKMGLAMFLLATFQITSGYFRPAAVSKPESNLSHEKHKGVDESENATLNAIDNVADNQFGKISIFSPKTLDRAQLRRYWEIMHNLLGVSLFLCGVWQMWRGMHLFHRRYYESVDSFGSTMIYTFYIIWMLLWSLIIVGGSAFKWIHRGVLRRLKAETKSIDDVGSSNEKGTEVVGGKFEIGDNDEDATENERLEEEVRAVI